MRDLIPKIHFSMLKTSRFSVFIIIPEIYLWKHPVKRLLALRFEILRDKCFSLIAIFNIFRINLIYFPVPSISSLSTLGTIFVQNLGKPFFKSLHAYSLKLILCIKGFLILLILSTFFFESKILQFQKH